jgi:hypothetical protein
MKKLFVLALSAFTFSLFLSIDSNQTLSINSAKAFGPCCDTEDKSICGLDGVNYPDHYLSKETGVNQISF